MSSNDSRVSQSVRGSEPRQSADLRRGGTEKLLLHGDQRPSGAGAGGRAASLEMQQHEVIDLTEIPRQVCISLTLLCSLQGYQHVVCPTGAESIEKLLPVSACY